MAQSAIKSIGVIVKPHQPDALETLCALTRWMSERGIAFVGLPEIEREQIEHHSGCQIQVLAEAEMPRRVDLMLVLGGDGTMIATARMLGDMQVPVIGVNYGGLGYLAEFPIDEMFPALEAILVGAYTVQQRLMLKVELWRGEELITQNRVLNDVVVNKSALARIIAIEASLNNQFVNSFRADGLIVATPTGSTAYNLSAGGPIIFPSMQAMVITPICPFTLSNRPIVVPDDSIIEVQLITENEEVALTLDGQVGFSLQARDRIVISKSSTAFDLVQPPNRNYFEVLRNKLKWGR
ncbi:MAG TPA: NAD(+)/NADH kinase [Pyrinomonadaceae bacterium]|nr:NAD(+)/NADH kinase [Pyrinomonadaceae bacterium]